MLETRTPYCYRIIAITTSIIIIATIMIILTFIACFLESFFPSAGAVHHQPCLEGTRRLRIQGLECMSCVRFAQLSRHRARCLELTVPQSQPAAQVPQLFCA